MVGSISPTTKTGLIIEMTKLRDAFEAWASMWGYGEGDATSEERIHAFRGFSAGRMTHQGLEERIAAAARASFEDQYKNATCYPDSDRIRLEGTARYWAHRIFPELTKNEPEFDAESTRAIR
jgi:hypothetical protein